MLYPDPRAAAGERCAVADGEHRVLLNWLQLRLPGRPLLKKRLVSAELGSLPATLTVWATFLLLTLANLLLSLSLFEVNPPLVSLGPEPERPQQQLEVRAGDKKPISLLRTLVKERAIKSCGKDYSTNISFFLFFF